MPRINLLRFKNPLLDRERAFRENWDNIDPEGLLLPEITLQGSEVLHTDEFGYILDDMTSDQSLEYSQGHLQARLAVDKRKK